MEGYNVTEAEAKARGISYPTTALKHANPGNIRAWADAHGRPYPQAHGYVDFVAWAAQQFPGLPREEMSARATAEGWRVLRVLISCYLDGKYTEGKPPTVRQMYAKYAPAADANDPNSYAGHVAAALGIHPDTKISDLITA
jgi:hypothetical protein